jgi:hypothetical protein
MCADPAVLALGADVLCGLTNCRDAIAGVASCRQAPASVTSRLSSAVIALLELADIFDTTAQPVVLRAFLLRALSALLGVSYGVIALSFFQRQSQFRLDLIAVGFIALCCKSLKF